MSNIFGTDGIRGKANIYPITSEVALALGRAVAYKAIKRSSRPKIIVGKDTRLSCYMLETALISGICSMGADALMTGPIPTPGIAYLTKDMRCDAGIMITASHNPYTDNGIKVFGPDGFKLSDAEEQELEAYILSHQTIEQFIPADDELYPKEDRIGKTFKMEDAGGRYISHLKSAFPSKLDLCGMRIAIDCANGAAYKIAPSVFRELGAEVIVTGNEPNGININEMCGAIHTGRLSLATVGHYCNMGFAFDGDADRLVVIDEHGEQVDGDVILAMVSGLQECNSPGLVVTQMSNMALHEFIKKTGTIAVTDIGDRYVIEEMRKTGIQIGGEQSGHIIFSNYSTTGDGILSALKVLEYLLTRKEQFKTMSEATKIITPFPQCLVNIDVKQKIPIEQVEGLQERIDDARSKLGDSGRILVRYSGTESKLRIMVEAKEWYFADKYSRLIAEYARSKLQ